LDASESVQLSNVHITFQTDSILVEEEITDDHLTRYYHIISVFYVLLHSCDELFQILFKKYFLSYMYTDHVLE